MTAGDQDDPTQILEARARMLAQPADVLDDGDRQEFLIASVGSARVAWDIRQVREVLPPGPIARLPGDGHLLAGVRNVGGALVAVADLASLLGLVHDLSPPARWAVIIDDGGTAFGIQVDRPDELVVTDLASLRSAPTSAERPATGVISHLLPDGALVVDTAALRGHPALSIGLPRDELNQEEVP